MTASTSLLLSIPKSPRSPRKVKGKKARSYRLTDLLEDLETGDFSVYQPAWLLRPFGWNGETLVLPTSSPSTTTNDNNTTSHHSKPVHLVRQALKAQAYRALTLVVESCHVTQQETSQALLLLASHPPALHQMHCLHLLLDHGAKAEFTDAKGRTALHLAYLSQQASMEFLSTLCMHMNVNVTDKAGNAVLHLALRRGDADTVRVLLRHGANPNLCDGKGRLPLVLAAHVPQSDACLQSLLRHGADVNATNAAGRPLLRLVENPAAALVLLQRGAQSHVRDAMGVTALHTALRLWCRWRRGENLSLVLFQEKTLAQWLWKQASVAAVNDADKCTANTANTMTCLNNQLCDVYGRTPLHYAAEVRYAPAPEYVQAWVEHQGPEQEAQLAALQAVDVNGWTALHVAVAFGNYATAVRLIQLGANVHARDTAGRTPLHCAGYDAWATRCLPKADLSYAVRVVAFGKHQAPPAAYMPPLSEASKADQLEFEQHYLAEEEDTTDAAAQDLMHCIQYQGFDFTMTDHAGNLPFGRADNDTLRYLAVLAAAQQGLLG